MAAITWSASGGVWAVAAFVLAVLCRLEAWWLPRQEVLLAALMGAGFSLVAGQVVKRLVGRQRPFKAIEGFSARVWAPSDPSFPSTHTSTAIALLVGLVVAGHPWAVWLAPWCLVVPLTRVVLGVHYPSDILGGAVLGASFGTVDCMPLLVWLLALGR